MKKKLLAILLCLAMVISMLPSMAFAATDEVKYMTWDDTQKKLVEKPCTNYTLVTSSDKNWNTTNGGWYVVDGEITISNTVTCAGAIHLILKDDANLTVTGGDNQVGICVTGSNSLTIYGQSGQTGQLTATGSSRGAGIGGGSEGNGSNITINGGSVTANGGENGAGIGGGSDGNGSNITINGGSVEANGGENGAGIGGGSDGAGTSITINGGSVTATGGDDGAGIGGGSEGDGFNITVAADLAVKTSDDDTEWTEIEHESTTDLSEDEDFSDKTYVKTEPDIYKHTIVLKEGKAYLDKVGGTDVTDIMASMGLKYVTEAPAHWEMNNFNFTTTAATAVEFADAGTAESPADINITVKGTNTIQGGDSTSNAYGLFFSGSNANVTISSINTTDSMLNVTAGNSPDYNSFGLYTASSLSFENLTATFTAGEAKKISGGAYTEGNLTVGDGADITCNSVASDTSIGNATVGKLSVTGTGKLVAKCSGTSQTKYGVSSSGEPDAKALVTDTDTLLTWDTNTYKNNGAVATDVTLIHLHKHTWSYTSDGATMTATCTCGEDTECDYNGKTGADCQVSVSIIAPTLTVYGQTGEDISEKATLSGITLGGLTLSADDIKYYKKTGDSYGNALSAAPADAGDYKAEITVNDGTNDHTLIVTYSIQKGTASVTTAPATKTLTYTGELQELVTAGDGVTGGTLQYASGSDTTNEPTSWSDVIPAGTNAGTYYVWYKVISNDTDNYQDSNPVCITVTIAPKDITGATITGIEAAYTYTGSAIEPQVTVTSDSKELTGTTDYTVEYGENTNAGAKAGTVTITGTGNYTGTKVVTFAINKTTLQLNDFTFAPPENLTYDGNKKLATVEAATDITGMGKITVRYYSDANCTEEVTPVVDKGTYYVGITVEEGDNYEAVTETMHDSQWTFTIAQATDNAITGTLTCADIVVDGTPDPTGASAKYGTAEYLYSADGGKTWGTWEDTYKGVGEYQVKAVVDGTDNYNKAESEAVSFSVRSSLTISISGDDTARHTDVKSYTIVLEGNRPAGTTIVWDITGGSYEYVGDHIGTNSVSIICEDVGTLHIHAVLVDYEGKPVVNSSGEIVEATKDVTVKAQSGNIINMIASFFRKIFGWLFG